MSIIYAHWQKPMPRAVTACKYTTKFPSPQHCASPKAEIDILSC